MSILNLFKIKPNQITIDISGCCNAHCPFCLRQMTQDVPSGLMPKEMFYEIMKQVRKIKSIKIVSLSAYGEAMLHPDFDEFVNYLYELNYKILVITNMSLANKHFESLLKTHFIIMSVEGYDKTTYEKSREGLSFEQVEYNIEQFDKIIKEERLNKHHTPERMINCLLNTDTEIEKYNQKWQNLVDIVRVNYMVNPISWDKENNKFTNISNSPNIILEANEKSERIICKEPFKTIVVHPNGDLALCCNDANSKLDFGNYKNIKKSFLFNKNLNKIRKELLSKNPVICEKCTNNIIINRIENKG